jgi:hypothetical protein
MSSLPTQGPIATYAGYGSSCGRSAELHLHSWLRVPARAEPVIGRAFARPVGLAGTTEIVDPLFKQPHRTHDSAMIPHSRGAMRPSHAKPPASNQRVQGTPGTSRTHSLACEVKKHTSVVTAVAAGPPGIPCAMVLTAYFGLSPVIGLSCHRHRRDAKHRRQLDTSVEASGPHDFAVRTRLRKSRTTGSVASRRSFSEAGSAPFVSRHCRVHRIPCPTSVTIAIRPSK